MIEPQTQEAVKYSELKHEHTFSMELSAKAFHVFSSQLYKNKIRAIIRELSCNAVDAQVEAGTMDKPFEVKLPSLYEPYFYIRDYGTGISEQDMFRVFTVVFSSTKTHSNDFTGMLGLGSKSPFSYTNTFTVSSYQDGVEKIYIAVKENGKIPTMDKVHEGATEQPNGLKIQFSVLQEDFRDFTREARHVFKSFTSLKPTLIGTDFQVDELQQDFVYYDQGNVWIDKASDGRHKQAYIVQGNVAYPLYPEDTELDFFQKYNWNHDIYFQVPVGTVTFTPPREELEDTEENTQRIEEILSRKSFIDELEAIVDAHIGKINSQYDACLFVEQIHNLELDFKTSRFREVIESRGFKYAKSIHLDWTCTKYKPLKIKALGMTVTVTPSRLNKPKVFIKYSIPLSHSAIMDYIQTNKVEQYYVVSATDLELVTDFLAEIESFADVIYSTDLLEDFKKKRLVTKTNTVLRKYFRKYHSSSVYTTLEDLGMDPEEEFFYIVKKSSDSETEIYYNCFRDFLSVTQGRRTPLLIVRAYEKSAVKKNFPLGIDIEKHLHQYLEQEVGARRIKDHLERKKFLDDYSSDFRDLLLLYREYPRNLEYPYKLWLHSVFKENKKRDRLMESIEACFDSSWRAKRILNEITGKYFSSRKHRYHTQRRSKKLQIALDWYREHLPLLFLKSGLLDDLKHCRSQKKQGIVNNLQVLIEYYMNNTKIEV